MMVRVLFAIYRKSPYRVREIWARLVVPLQWLMWPFRRIAIPAFYLSLDFTDKGSFKYFVDRGDYERTELDLFLTIGASNPGAYVIDVGASYGMYSLTAAAYLGRLGLVPGVVAIEPDPRLYRCLLESVERNRMDRLVHVFQCAAGDSVGTSTLAISRRSSAGNRSGSLAADDTVNHMMVQVPSTTVDTLAVEAGVRAGSPLLVKIDVEGNEPRVLRGMGNVLSVSAGYAIFYEYAPYLIQRSGMDLDEFRNTIKALEVDAWLEVRHGRVVDLGTFEGFVESNRAVERSTDRRYAGGSTNYVLIKGLDGYPAR